MFTRPFRRHGIIRLSIYIRVYKVADIVDIKGHGAVQKGMVCKAYQGKTGRVYNDTPYAVSVIVNKRLRSKILPKRVNDRIEHVRCNKRHFVPRVKENEHLLNEANAKGTCKHEPAQPTLLRKSKNP